MIGMILITLLAIFLWAMYHSGKGVIMAEKELERMRKEENKTSAERRIEKREIHRLFR